MLEKLETPEPTYTPVGVDVASEKFDVGIEVPSGLHGQSFLMKKRGFNDLRNWLKKNGIERPHLWMEATGRYWERLAEWALAQGWKVTVVNPRAIKHYGISKLKKNKTDRIDARTILRFAQASKPHEYREWKPKTATQMELRDLQLEIQGLKKCIDQERNRLKCGLTSLLVKESIKRTIAEMQVRKRILQKASTRLIKSDPNFRIAYDALISICGLGNVTIALLLAKIDFANFSKGRQLLKFAGLEPVSYESGKSVKKKRHISREGHSALRAALYWPSVAAMTHDPKTKEFADGIIERSGSKKVAICAVMGRLLRVAFARVRDAVKAHGTLPA